MLYGTHALAQRAAVVGAPPRSGPGTAFLVSLAGSLILVGLVAALGAPLRAEEEACRRVRLRPPMDDEAWEEA